MSIIRRITMLGAIAAIVASFALPGNANAAAEHEWKMAASWGGGPLMEIGAKAIAEKVNFHQNAALPACKTLRPVEVNDHKIRIAIQRTCHA